MEYFRRFWHDPILSPLDGVTVHWEAKYLKLGKNLPKLGKFLPSFRYFTE